MKKLPQIFCLLLILAALTACTVSGDERASCEALGGTVKDDTFPYDGTGFWDSTTGPLYYCEVDGAMVEVYNDEILEPDTGFLGDGEDNFKVFERCRAIEGRVYDTYVSKQGPFFVCVAGKRVKPILYSENV